MVYCLLKISSTASAQTVTSQPDSVKKTIATDTTIKKSLTNPAAAEAEKLQQSVKALSPKQQAKAAKLAAKKKAKAMKAALDSSLKVPGSIVMNNALVKSVKKAGDGLNINDTAMAQKALAPVKQLQGKLQGDVKALSPKKQISEFKATAKKSTGQLTSKLDSSLNMLKKKPVSASLVLQNDIQYQPAPLLTDPAYHPKYAVVFGAIGNINLFGIPLNVNLSSNQRNVNGMGGPVNNLFKFDLDPRQLTGLYQNQVQRFYELRKDVFAGQDLTGYTRNMLNDQLKSNQLTASGKQLSTYLNNPESLNKLLLMSEQDASKQMVSQMQKGAGLDSMNSALPHLMKAQLNDQSTAVNKMAVNPNLQQYLNDPKNRQSLNSMTQAQAETKLEALLADKEKKSPAPGNFYFSEHMPVHGFDLAAMIDRAAKRKEIAHRKAIHDIAGKLTGPKPVTAEGLAQIFTGQSDTYQQQSALVSNGNLDKGQLQNMAGSVTDPAMVKHADSIAATMAMVKAQLAGKGFDTKSLLEMQKLMGGNGKIGGLTEQDQALLAKNPQNGMQSILSRLTGLKIGSFGDQVPGSTQGQDMFTGGAKATFKLGYTPITVGYGSQNDVRSLKDADFQSTVYNAPRNMTYLGTDIKRGIGGDLKISLIGSTSQQNNSSQYSMPTISSNNVALTIAKAVKMGKAGDAEFDVSKTTTVYANKYVPETEALLDKKAGLTNDLSTDMFQTLSFGATHHLDVKELDMSENFYINYSGMGYQNPGNNGNGGGMFKVGGNVKKSFYKKKLTVNLRTDIKDQAISYTSNDQWKSLQVQIDSKYQISKKFNLDLKYTNNATDKKVDGAVTPVYSLQKLQLDGNATYKIGKNYSVSHFSIGQQSLSNTYAAAGAASMLMMNYTQTLLLKKKSLTFNAFYNRELAAFKLIGNMLNSDLTYQVPLTKKINITSGVTYLDNTGIARQMGIREGVQIASAGHFDIGSDVDLRKNLIAPQYPDLYANVRAEITIKYHLTY